MALRSFALFLLALSLIAGRAFAADAVWQVSAATGAVSTGSSGFATVAVTNGGSLARDAWVQTGENGRVLLVRGSESIMLGPNSRIDLPSREVNGATNILQSLGSALYNVGKQQTPHFQVDTPFMAAIVKGTTFTVSVDEYEASVTVEEGIVEVATPDRVSIELLLPGRKGVVTAHDPNTIVTSKTDVQPAKATSNEKAVTRTSALAVLITQPVGELDLNVKDASQGLASDGGANAKNAAADVMRSETAGEAASALGKDKGSSEPNGNGNGLGNNPNLAGGDTGVGAAPDLSPGGGNGNGNGGGNNGNGVGPDLGSPGVGVAPDLGGGPSNGNGNGPVNGVGTGNNNAGGNGGGNGGVGNGNGQGNGKH